MGSDGKRNILRRLHDRIESMPSAVRVGIRWLLLLIIWGCIFPVALIIGAVSIKYLFDVNVKPPFSHLLLVGAGSIIGYVSIFAVRLTSSKAESIMPEGEGRLVLYLRSFTDDNQYIRGSWSKISYEQVLLSVLKDVGEARAIGNPTESIPTLGANRLYTGETNEEEWKELVRSLMQKATLIVFQAGATQGLVWELTTAVKENSSDKLLISFLPWEKLIKKEREQRYQQFRSALHPVISTELPAEIGKASFLSFEPDWTPRLHGPRKWQWFFLGQLATNHEGIREVLRPLLKSRGIHLKWRWTILAGVVYSLILTAGLIALLSTSWWYLSGERERELKREQEMRDRISRAIQDLNRLQKRKSPDPDGQPHQKPAEIMPR